MSLCWTVPWHKQWRETRGAVDNNWVSWWQDEPKWVALDVENSRMGKIWEEHTTAMMLTSLCRVRKRFMSSRCYNYFTWKAGRGDSERGGKERERRSSQHVTPPVIDVVWLSDLLTISGRTLSKWTRWWNDMKETEGENEAGQYEWLRVRGSVSLGSLIMTYLLELSVSPIAHTT